MLPRTIVAALSSVLVALAAPGAGTAAPDQFAPASAPARTAPAAHTEPAAHTASAAHAVSAGTVSAATDPLVVRIEGRGFGHGRGMSQWGARGAAEAPSSLPWRDIVAFYYPGTVVASVPDSAIRIRLTEWGSGATTVLAASGLTLDIGTCTELLPTTAIAQWRALLDGAVWRVEYLPTSAGSVWQPFASTCAFADAGTVTFRTTSQAGTSTIALVRPAGSTRSYRGWARAVRSGSGQATVNVVTLEQYLWGVVASEMPGLWPAEALASQAVAARSYSARTIGSPGAWDLCDTTACQVYTGIPGEYPTTTAAIQRTAGAVLTYAGAIAFTEFSAYNGGWIAPGSVPYQVGKADPYDGRNATPAASWYLTLSAATLQSAYPSIGRFVGIGVARDGQGRWGGRVTAVTLRGTAGDVTVSGESFRSRFGTRSTYFNPTVSGRPGTDFDGDGHTDVLARQTSTGALWLYPGNGTGGWLPRKQIGVGWSSFSQLTGPGDFNGDGFADVLARHTPTGVLWLYPGNGHGGWLAPVRGGGGWGGFSELTDIGDFNSDGSPDLLARRTADGTLWLYPGNGRGGWLRSVQVGVGWSGFSELTGPGDFNGDGFVDLLARYTSTGALWLYPGNGMGGWLRSMQVGVGWRAFAELTGPGDFNGDGFVDLLARRTSTGGLWLYRSNGRGGWLAPIQVGTGWTGFSALTS